MQWVGCTLATLDVFLDATTMTLVGNGRSSVLRKTDATRVLPFGHGDIIEDRNEMVRETIKNPFSELGSSTIVKILLQVRNRKIMTTKNRP